VEIQIAKSFSTDQLFTSSIVINTCRIHRNAALFSFMVGGKLKSSHCKIIEKLSLAPKQSHG